MMSAACSILFGAALRALLAACALWAGLRLLRVRNVWAQKAAWSVVLVAALAMPLLICWRWLPAWAEVRLPVNSWSRVLSEAQLPAPAAASAESGVQEFAVTPLAPAAPDPIAMPRARNPQRFEVQPYAAPNATLRSPSSAASPKETTPQKASRDSFSLLTAGWLVYLAVGTALLLRLLIGLGSSIRLWLRAKPVTATMERGFDCGIPIRSSSCISSPVNIGSGIVLPADYLDWDAEKLRVVLAHEGSHVRQHDFYLQLLAGLYTAFNWFSPLGWWLKRKLTELSEAISDRAGLAEAASRPAYAQLLLEFAALPRPTLIGVAMARRSNLPHRIEQLLNETLFRQAFAGSRQRAVFAALLVPAVLFCSAAMIRVEAAETSQAMPRSAPSAVTAAASMAQSPAEPAQSSAANPAVPPAPPANPPAVGTMASPDSTSASLATPAQPTPEVATAPELEARIAGLQARLAKVEAGAPELEARIAELQAKLMKMQAGAPELDAGIADLQSRLMKLEAAAPQLQARIAELRSKLMVVQAAASQDQTFDRTLTVSGQAELSVATGSGNIHLTDGTAGQVRIHGIVRAGHGATDEQVREIVANPPIEQNGNSIHVGAHGMAGGHNISISYEIEAPADTALNASTGSGNIVDDGVGQNAKLSTGSGNINAAGLQGGFTIITGSGDVQVEGSGEGDGKAQTGSGNIDLKNVRGGLKAQTGSGDIKVAGTPSAPWRLMTGSGDVELWAGNAPMTLEASTGSGGIHTDHEMVIQGSVNPHHVVGKINGGGTEVRIETGSGGITVH